MSCSRKLAGTSGRPPGSRPIQIHGWAELPLGEYGLMAYLRSLSSDEGGELAAPWTVD